MRQQLVCTTIADIVKQHGGNRQGHALDKR